AHHRRRYGAGTSLASTGSRDRLRTECSSHSSKYKKSDRLSPELLGSQRKTGRLSRLRFGPEESANRKTSRHIPRISFRSLYFPLQVVRITGTAYYRKAPRESSKPN